MSAGATDHDDIDVAEFVLGTLDQTTHDAILRRLETDPALAGAVAAWEARLAPMAMALDPVRPSRHLKPRIDATIASGAATADDRSPSPRAADVVALRRGITLWRWTAGATGIAAAAAAAMAAFLLVRQPMPDTTTATRLVAVLRPLNAAEAPTWVVSAEAGAGYGQRRLLVQALGLPTADGLQGARDYELWALPGGDAAPVSLGVIDPRAGARVAVPRDMATRLASGLGLAVSIEPAGGSTTGAPTGPVVLIGSLTAAPQ